MPMVQQLYQIATELHVCCIRCRSMSVCSGACVCRGISCGVGSCWPLSLQFDLTAMLLDETDAAIGLTTLNFARQGGCCCY